MTHFDFDQFGKYEETIVAEPTTKCPTCKGDGMIIIGVDQHDNDVAIPCPECNSNLTI